MLSFFNIFMAIIETRMYVCTNSDANKNKFWEVTLHDSGQVTTRNGRVGSAGADNDLGLGGKSLFDSKIREKERKLYKLVPVVGTSTAKSLDSHAVQQAAQEQVAQGDPILAKLMKRLAEENRHQLLMASGGQIDLNLSTGIVKTPVGVVTLSNVQTARTFLPKLDAFVQVKDFTNKQFADLLNNYLMLVPQKVAAQRGWHEKFLLGDGAMERQAGLLDQLESSIELAEKEIALQLDVAKGQTPKIFDVKLHVVEDKQVLDMVKKMFRESLNTRHASSRLRPVQVYELDIPTMAKSWESDGAKLTNQRMLWHGTRTHNVLSILKQGLIIPKRNGSIAVNGRMFGDGLYFSDQSSKSLNYSQGYWDAGRKDNKCFMFLSDVALGRMYRPRGSFSGVVDSKYDSTFAEGQKSGVMNNEMIIYRTSQANLRYLIEFTD